VRIVLLFFCVIAFISVNAQSEDSLIAEIKEFQEELNEHYTNKETSPLKKKERKQFEGHRFFEIDLNYRVFAKVHILHDPDTIVMPTSAGTEKKYLRYAELRFRINGEDCVLIAYERAKTGSQNYLFLPFRDKTTGTDSYGGGKYLDIEIPSTDQIVLNFNLAYNPYCAYTTGWFCPLPPDENTLKVRIEAGLKVPLVH
jgi:uncharacterized protein